MDTVEMLKEAARAALDKKAENIIVQDLRGLSDVCHFQMICSGSNTRQTQAITDNIEDALKKNCKLRTIAIEGKKGGTWILLDYGWLMVHVFEETIREYYSLEQLWAKAKTLDLIQ
jgi:ribosome-associated protein